MKPLGLYLAALALLGSTVGEVQAASPTISPGQFDFQLFRYAGNPYVLGVQQMNNLGTMAGFVELGSEASPGAYQGFTRSLDGNFSTLIDPQDKGGAINGDTEAFGLNDSGTVVGYFYNIGAGYDSGFFYADGKFTNYNLPSQPGQTSTALTGINEDGSFCGWVQYPPNTFPNQSNWRSDSFVSVRGAVTIFSIAGATATYVEAINRWGQTAGEYIDVQGVYHGFYRDTNGAITTIDVPGAPTTLPSTPTPYCYGNSVAGTEAFGLNDFGFISGHYFDAQNNYHGFVRTPDNHYFQIDVPGALETAGGGINDWGVVVGHYVDKNGNQQGYFAAPKLDQQFGAGPVSPGNE